jgi:hypothetical protein
MLPNPDNSSAIRKLTRYRQQSQVPEICISLINKGLLIRLGGASGLRGIPSYWECRSRSGPRNEEIEMPPIIVID